MEAASAELEVEVVTPLPERIAVGGGTAVFLDGRCRAGRELESLEIIFDGTRHQALGFGVAPPRMRGEDYWWAIVPIPGVAEPHEATVELRAHVGAGRTMGAALGSVHLDPGLERAGSTTARSEGGPGPLVAVCIAAYEPDPAMFEVQIESIRAQTHRNWVCLISDDASNPRALAQVERVINGDPRFQISVAGANLGFYANFERALAMVPPEAEMVALSDQDDRWYPDKLERLLGGLDPDAGLVFSDMRITTTSGRVLADTYWDLRPVNHTDFGGLVIANTVTGAASLFRASLLDDILPFPPRHGAAFHDHWIAQVAMALGPISYLDAPTYDYVQHEEAALGFLRANGEGRYSAPLSERVRIWYGRWSGRGYRLGWRVPYFRLYCRVRVAITALRLRLGERMSHDRLAVLERIADDPGGIAWLARRGARDLGGATSTIGRERVMLAGLAWRRGAEARRRLRGLRRRLLTRS
jgi:glycosyltransferase involved in cell wall biosynthesis